MDTNAVNYNLRPSYHQRNNGCNLSKIMGVVSLYILAIGIQVAYFWGLAAFFHEYSGVAAVLYGAALIVAWALPASLSFSCLRGAAYVYGAGEIEMVHEAQRLSGDL